MANTLSAYDPIFYAQEALMALEKALGLAGRVYRGFDRDPGQIGKVTSIRKPSTFTAQNAPGSDMNIEAGEVQITLDQWKEVKFALTDQELAWTGERIVDEHIRPAAYALADAVDQALAAQYVYIPWYHDDASPTDATDITGARKVMRNNAVPLDDPNMMHLMVDGDKEADFLGLNIFHSAATTGGAGNEAALMRGSLGTRFGMEVFANQNVPSHTEGTASVTTLAVATTTAALKGAAVLDIDAGSVTGTLVPGDTFIIAGHSQRYAVTGTFTASTNVFSAVTISPALAADAAEDAVITLNQSTHTANIGFHRNAFALATAPLSEMGNAVGANIATVADPTTNLALRSRIWYDGDNSTVKVGLDLLYGIKCLDPNLAVILRSDRT